MVAKENVSQALLSSCESVARQNALALKVRCSLAVPSPQAFGLAVVVLL